MAKSSANIERLECVYYSGPVPSDWAVLTTLCFVFDKIYFPCVHLPLGDYDKNDLLREITRLRELNDNSRETAQLIWMLQFLEARNTLDGILEYPSPASIFSSTRSDKIHKSARIIYDANFLTRENFEPSFSSGYSKALPGSEQSVDYAGDFFYQAEALAFAAERQIPVLDDGSGLALPFKAKYKDQVQSLSTIMAIESIRAVLPELPILKPREIVEFRMENLKELKNFRAAMLRLTGTLNSQIADNSSDQDVQRKAKVIVETEVIPALHDLKQDLSNPNRAWHRRWIDGVGIASSLAIGTFFGPLGAAAVNGVKNLVTSELEGKGNKLAAAKRNGLYYLIRAQGIQR